MKYKIDIFWLYFFISILNCNDNLNQKKIPNYTQTSSNNQNIKQESKIKKTKEINTRIKEKNSNTDRVFLDKDFHITKFEQLNNLSGNLKDNTYLDIHMTNKKKLVSTHTEKISKIEQIKKDINDIVFQTFEEENLAKEENINDSKLKNFVVKVYNKLMKDVNPIETQNDNLININKIGSKEKIVLLFHGLDSNKKTMNNIYDKLQSYGHIINICRSKINKKPINIQSKYVKEILEKIVYLENLKNLILIGHSIGGNIALEALYLLISNCERSLLTKIQKLKIKFVFIACPLKGSIIANQLDLSFIKLLGIDISNKAFIELRDSQKICIRVKKIVEYISEILKNNLEIKTIVCKSNFIKGMTKIFKNIKIPGLGNFLNLMNLVGLVNVGNIDNFYKRLENLEENDAIVSIDSQSGSGVLNQYYHYTNKDCLINHCHVDFKRYVPKIVSKGIPSNEIPELNSDRVLERIISYL